MNTDTEIRTKKLQSACINALLEEDYKFSIEDSRIILSFNFDLPDGKSSENMYVTISAGAYTIFISSFFNYDIPKDRDNSVFEFILRVNNFIHSPATAKLNFTFVDDIPMASSSDDYVSIEACNGFGRYYDDRDVKLELSVIIDDVLDLYRNCAYPLRRIIDAGMDAESAFEIYKTIVENNNNK